jgi:hypothetical protein
MLKEAVMPTTQITVKKISRTVPSVPGKNWMKNCAWIQRHADEKFYLVVQQAAVIQKSDEGEQRCAREDAGNLLQRNLANCEDDAEYES